MSDKEGQSLGQTREVLLESIESQRDRLLAEEEKRASLVGKGKSPATTLDHERAAQMQQEMQNLGERWTYITEHRDTEMRDDWGLIPGHTLSLVSRSGGPGKGRSTKVQSESALPSTRKFRPFETEEPVWDPMTSSFAYQETGFEPGPSASRGGHRALPNHDFNGPEPLSVEVS